MSKLLSPKLSEFEFFSSEQMELKVKKLKFLNARGRKKNFEFPEIRRNSQQIYNRLNLSHMPSSQLSMTPKISISPNSLQQYLKEREFFRCQSIHSKTHLKDDGNNCEDSLIGEEERMRSPVKLKKSLSDINSEYDDRKIKQTKNFDIIEDMRQYIPSIKTRLYGSKR